jgi:alpha-D-ribose 1-methylphosphonate 5-triphosphate synthase subunit PhnH
MKERAAMVPMIPAAGFADPTRDAQRVFRAVLDALAHPTRRYPLTGPAEPPSALGRGLGAVALTVLDEECTVWLGGCLETAEVEAWLYFHTGVRLVTDAADADFLFASPSALPLLAGLAVGSDEAPHRSATVVFDIRGCSGDSCFRAEGPGLNGAAALEAPWANDDFLAQWQLNHELFPRGIDLLLVDDGAVSALPRTTRLTAAEPGQDT